MNKRGFKLILLGLALVFIPWGSFGQTLVSPSRSEILVDGEKVDFEAYLISGSNYFKLRDLAQALNNTKSRFSVDWLDELKTIELKKNQAYRPIGGELESSNIVSAQAVKSRSPILVDGEKHYLTSYNIGGNNYFKLRDLGQLLNFSVSYNESSRRVGINSKGDLEGVGILKGLKEYKLELKYGGKDIEFEYELKRSGQVEAEYDNELEGIKLKGPRAASLIESRLLNLDYTGDEDRVIGDILRSLGLDKKPQEIDLEIEYYDKKDLKIKRKFR